MHVQYGEKSPKPDGDLSYEKGVSPWSGLDLSVSASWSQLGHNLRVAQ